MTRYERWIAQAAVLVLAAGAVGCSTSSQPRFHTLLPSNLVQRPAAAPLNAPWALAPVNVPAQVDQPQFTVRDADGTMVRLEQERWIAPLRDEVHAALAERLAPQLGALEGVRLPGQRSTVWRITVDVLRFDSEAGRVGLDAAWSLRGEADASSLSCRSHAERPVAAGVPALSAGHRQLLADLADRVAATLRRLDASERVACP